MKVGIKKIKRVESEIVNIQQLFSHISDLTIGWKTTCMHSHLFFSKLCKRENRKCFCTFFLDVVVVFC